MKKLICGLLVCISFFIVAGCDKTVMIIDWTDFIKINDTSYENQDAMNVPKIFIAEEIGEVTGNVPSQVEGNKMYEPKNGEASRLAIGVKLFRISGYDESHYIAALEEGTYLLYRTHESQAVKFDD